MAYVLIVDDDEDFSSAAARVLRSAGHEVQAALDPENGLQSVRQRKPDLIILDVMFPEDSAAGFNLARTLHAEGEDLARVPVLMLTAVNAKFPLGFGPDDLDNEWLPVNKFLEKPIALEVLRDTVEQMLTAQPSA